MMKIKMKKSVLILLSIVLAVIMCSCRNVEYIIEDDDSASDYTATLTSSANGVTFDFTEYKSYSGLFNVGYTKSWKKQKQGTLSKKKKYDLEMIFIDSNGKSTRFSMLEYKKKTNKPLKEYAEDIANNKAQENEDFVQVKFNAYNTSDGRIMYYSVIENNRNNGSLITFFVDTGKYYCNLYFECETSKVSNYILSFMQTAGTLCEYDSTASSKAASSKATSSKVTSTTAASSKAASSKATSSKSTSSKSTSSKSTSSKSTSSKSTSSKSTSSKSTSSKSTSSKNTSTTTSTTASQTDSSVETESDSSED